MAHESNQKPHVHEYRQTNKWGMWITDPRRPAGQRRLYCGAYDTKYLALRAQDRANLKFNPDMRSSGELNFKASDYDMDQELRDRLSCENFRKFLMGESRSCYKKWAPSPCWKKFLDEERAKSNLPKGPGKKSVKSLATALQELTHKTKAAASKARVAPVAKVHPQSDPCGQGRIAELTKRSAAHQPSRSTPIANRISATPLKDLQLTGMRQARKVFQPAALPVRQAPKLVQPINLPVRRASTVREPNKLAIQQVQPSAPEWSQQSETDPAEQSQINLVPLDRLDTGKRYSGTKRIIRPTEAAPALKLSKRKKVLDREPDASSTGSSDGLSDEIEELATTLISLKAGRRTA